MTSVNADTVVALVILVLKVSRDIVCLKVVQLRLEL